MEFGECKHIHIKLNKPKPKYKMGKCVKSFKNITHFITHPKKKGKDTESITHWSNINLYIDK